MHPVFTPVLVVVVVVVVLMPNGQGRVGVVLALIRAMIAPAKADNDGSHRVAQSL